MYRNVNYDSDYIPPEIKGLNQWKHSLSSDAIRVPCNVEYGHNKGFTFEDALTRVKDHRTKLMIGFYVTAEDPYVLVDIDDIDNPNDPYAELPPNLSYLVKTKQSYYEISQSGHGLRAIYKLPSVEDKAKLNGSDFRSNEQAKDLQRAHNIVVGSPWSRLTLNPTAFSTNTVATVTLEELDKCFALKYKKEGSTKNKVIPFSLPKELPNQSIPAFGEVSKALANLPLDANPRIRRAYKKVMKGENYDHYNYWLKIMMAVQDYSELIGDDVKCLELMMAWSRQDPFSYKGDDDVQSYWIGIVNREIGVGKEKITTGTLFALVRENTIHWPFLTKPPKTKEGEDPPPPAPVQKQFANFKELLNFYDIKLHHNSLQLYSFFLTGDEDIMDTWFNIYDVEKHFGKYYGLYSDKELIPLFQIFAQEHGFVGIESKVIKEFVIALICTSYSKVNLFMKYIDTPFNELPRAYKDNPQNYGTSTIDAVFDCLKIKYQWEGKKREKEKALYKSYLRSWLMGLVRSFYYEGEFKGNSGLLILTGVEKRYKTSFFKTLLPKPFRHYIAKTIHGFSKQNDLRDLSKISSDTLILTWEDIDDLIRVDTTANFKGVMDGESVKFVDKYAVGQSETNPIAIYGATSNKTKFNLADSGTRRLFLINVSMVETEKTTKICWHPIFRSLLEELKKPMKPYQLPWNLTEEEVDTQLKLHKNIKRETDLDLELGEIYDTNATLKRNGAVIPHIKSIQSDKTGMFQTLAQIKREIELHRNNNAPVKSTTLKNALLRLCGFYTQTERNDLELIAPKCTISKGRVTQSGRTRWWCMPPLLNKRRRKGNSFDK